MGSSAHIAVEPSQERDVLATLFTSRARALLLRTFLIDPHRAYYQRQLEAATGLAIRAIQRELDRLTTLELLYRREEGNRAYYQVDMLFPFFPELRALVVKACGGQDHLRALLAVDPAVRQALLHARAGRVLIVTHGAQRPERRTLQEMTAQVIAETDFAAALTREGAGVSFDAIQPFLTEGVDLLGRRDDVLWRRIAQAGHDVPKAQGVI